METKPAEDTELNSLESPDTTPLAGAGGPPDDDKQKDAGPKKSKSIGARVRALISHLNIYLLLFMLIMVLAIGFTIISIQKNKKEAAPTVIQTQSLTQEELDKLNGTDSSVGDPKQTLTVESNAIFSGKVLIRDSLDVAGSIKVGGPLSLPGLTVAGTASFDQIQANQLTVSGDTNIQGQLTAQKGLTVTGGASFGGPISAPQITVQSFQLSGDLQINRHIDAGGATPGKSDGNGLGSGGTVSVGGTDTAGTISVNIGGGSPSSGCFVTINFTQKFNATPHVVVTPSSSGGAHLTYYDERSTSNFKLCFDGPALGAGSFTFDYVVVD
jgi:cytoskeletal protein CcmA (bactofilin family)